MSASIQKEQAALKKEGGKLVKFLTAAKKLIAKEFLIVLVLAIIAIPVGYFLYLLFQVFASTDLKQTIAGITGDVPLYIWWYMLGFIGCYFTRTVVGAIASLIKKPSA